MQVGDIVVIKAEEGPPRNQRTLGRGVETHQGADGLLITVTLVVADGMLNRKGRGSTLARFLERPEPRLVLPQQA